MVTWTEPKTNWVTGDYFNIDPDYKRIKGNIEYLTELAQTIYVQWNNTKLSDVTIGYIPLVDFFNNVVKATQEIIDYTKTGGTADMPMYVANDRAWNSTELNNIEKNHLILHTSILNQRDVLKRISFKLNGGNF